MTLSHRVTPKITQALRPKSLQLKSTAEIRKTLLFFSIHFHLFCPFIQNCRKKMKFHFQLFCALAQLLEKQIEFQPPRPPNGQ